MYVCTVLHANGSDVKTFLKKVGKLAGENASHVWWTPQFRAEDSLYVPINLRSALAVANVAFPEQSSSLLERREGRFRKHFDVDVVCDDAFAGSIGQFFDLAMEDFSAVLSEQELECLSVSGFAGPFRGDRSRCYWGFFFSPKAEQRPLQVWASFNVFRLFGLRRRVFEAIGSVSKRFEEKRLLEMGLWE